MMKLLKPLFFLCFILFTFAQTTLRLNAGIMYNGLPTQTKGDNNFGP
jgi:hypothetical protein